MALFRRAAGVAPSTDGPRDPHLPMLSVEQAAALSALAESAFRQHGMPVTYGDDGSLHAGAQRYGLHNLATQLAGAPWRNWKAIVDNHARAVAHSVRSEPVEAARPEQFQLQLYSAEVVPELDYEADSPFPGVLALPAIDGPSHVKAMLQRRIVDGLGGLDAFRERALRNLRALPVPDLSAMRADEERADSAVHLFTGEDFFVASRALVLDDLLRAALKIEWPEHGCLVAIPNRHVLAVHVVEGLGVIAAIKLLVRIAATQYDGPGPLTNDVFYRPVAGPVQRITERTDGEVGVVVDGALAKAFTRLGLLGD